MTYNYINIGYRERKHSSLIFIVYHHLRHFILVPFANFRVRVKDAEHSLLFLLNKL